MIRKFLYLLILLLLGCAHAAKPRATQVSVMEIHQNIMLLEPKLKQFEILGPFEIKESLNREVALDLNETIVVDHFSASSLDKLPIVVISHGNFSSKQAHRLQAKHLASWGFHVVTVELPNRDRWLENGSRLTKLLEFLHRWPVALGQNVDQDRIIVAGHSFGGSAAILAMGNGAPVLGAILLDPAVVHKSVVHAMKQIELPVVLLGADKDVFFARGRESFAENLAGEILEITVPNATHDDAQGPSMFSKFTLGVDPFTSNRKQIIFRSMLTASVLSMATSGTLDFSTKVFQRESRSGRITDLKYKNRSLNSFK